MSPTIPSRTLEFVLTRFILHLCFVVCFEHKLIVPIHTLPPSSLRSTSSLYIDIVRSPVLNVPIWKNYSTFDNY